MAQTTGTALIDAARMLSPTREITLGKARQEDLAGVFRFSEHGASALMVRNSEGEEFYVSQAGAMPLEQTNAFQNSQRRIWLLDLEVPDKISPP